MSTLPRACTGLAAFAFVLAVVASFVGPILDTSPEGFSRPCTNLALLAIALVVTFPDPIARPGATATLGAA
jgi:hypothetical protein